MQNFSKGELFFEAVVNPGLDAMKAPKPNKPAAAAAKPGKPAAKPNVSTGGKVINPGIDAMKAPKAKGKGTPRTQKSAKEINPSLDKMKAPNQKPQSKETAASIKKTATQKPMEKTGGARKAGKSAEEINPSLDKMKAPKGKTTKIEKTEASNVGDGKTEKGKVEKVVPGEKKAEPRTNIDVGGKADGAKAAPAGKGKLPPAQTDAEKATSKHAGNMDAAKAKGLETRRGVKVDRAEAHAAKGGVAGKLGDFAKKSLKKGAENIGRRHGEKKEAFHQAKMSGKAAGLKSRAQGKQDAKAAAHSTVTGAKATAKATKIQGKADLKVAKKAGKQGLKFAKKAGKINKKYGVDSGEAGETAKSKFGSFLGTATGK